MCQLTDLDDVVRLLLAHGDYDRRRGLGVGCNGYVVHLHVFAGTRHQGRQTFVSCLFVVAVVAVVAVVEEYKHVCDVCMNVYKRTKKLNIS